MKKPKYKSQQGNTIVEVTPKARQVVDAINAATRIPKRHIVELALAEYAANNYASVLRHS